MSKFCPVCKAAGKSPEDYTSHFVKDKPDGVVVCPTLLEQECGYCHERGHTPKFCPKLHSPKKPFCPVCYNSGKSETEYTSHFVKDKPDGIVVCPTLLEQECRYCHQFGHTPKFCPKLAVKHLGMPAALHDQLVGDASFYRPSPPRLSANQRRQINLLEKAKHAHAQPRPASGQAASDRTNGPPIAFMMGGSQPPLPPNSIWSKPPTLPMQLLPPLLPLHLHEEMAAQQEDEEHISAWAGRSTAYTAEEEVDALAEMEAEAEFMDDSDHSSMPELISYSDDE